MLKSSIINIKMKGSLAEFEGKGSKLPYAKISHSPKLILLAEP